MDKDLLPFLVDRIRKLRGLSFRELAKDSGISSPSNLREWLLGLPARLSSERIGRVLKSSGLDPVTFSLAPGIHRWRIENGRSAPLREIVPLVFPDRLLFAWSRSTSPLIKTNWLLMARDSIRVIVEIGNADEEEIRSVAETMNLHALRKGVRKTSAEITLLPDDLALLTRSDLDSDTLDSLFKLSTDDSDWTYERLFERLWADGIEPADAAKRLGFF